MLTLTQIYPYNCPICGIEHSNHLPLFPCGHEMGMVDPSVPFAEWLDLFGDCLPLEFLESKAEVKIIDQWGQEWYFANNPTHDKILAHIEKLVAEKNGLEWHFNGLGIKTNWLENTGSASVYIKTAESGSFWIGTVRLDYE